jgi:hypothetical protein
MHGRSQRSCRFGTRGASRVLTRELAASVTRKAANATALSDEARAVSLDDSWRRLLCIENRLPKLNCSLLSTRKIVRED